MRKIIFICLVLVVNSSMAQDWMTLRDKAGEVCEAGDFKQAIELSGQAITKAAKDRKADPQEILSLRSENASYYILDEQVEEGGKLFKSVFGELSKSTQPLAEMNISQNYGIALMFLGQYEQASEYLARAAELGPGNKMKDKDLVAVLGSLAVCYQYKYDFARSLKIFDEAIGIVSGSAIKNTVDAASLYAAKALLYRDMRLPHLADEAYAKAGTIFKASADTLNPQYPVFLSEYATFLADRAVFDEGEGCLKRAAAIDLKMFGEQSTQYSSDLNNLGYLCDKMGRVAEAEFYYTKALEIKKKQSYTRIDALLTAYSNLLIFYYKTGRDAKAREMAAELEKGLSDARFTDVLKKALFYNNLGIYYNYWDNLPKSIQFLNEAVKYYKAVYGEDQQKEAEVYMDMAVTYFGKSDWTGMNASLEKAAGIYKKSPMQDSEDGLYVLCNLSTIVRDLEQPLEALKYSEQAVKSSNALNLKNTDLLALIWLTHAKSLSDVKRVKEATVYFGKYLDIKYRNINNDFSYMTEEEKMQYLNEFEKNVSDFFAFIISNIEAHPDLVKMLLDFRLKTKSLLFSNMLEMRKAVAVRKDPRLSRQFAQLSFKRETVAGLMKSGSEADITKAEALNQEANQLEKELSRELSLNASQNSAVLTWKDIQKMLGPGEAAIEIFNGRFTYDNNQGRGTNYTFIILRNQGDPVAVSIDRPLNWESAVMTHYRNSILKKTNDGSVYMRLWQPLASKLNDVNTIYLSPDGIYNQVNINTLFNSQSGKFVLEEKNIHLMESLRGIEAAKQKSPVPHTALLAGHPDFNKGLGSPQPAGQVATRSPYDFYLSDLPATKEEVESISGILTKAGVTGTVLMGSEATETKLKQTKSPDILHLATHGFFLKDVKSDGHAAGGSFGKDYFRNPMLRSGVFFSGANLLNTTSENASADDGMLTALEAMNLNLSGTKIVVLSACETGLGEVQNGEGVFGLQRAIRLAGSQSVLMSLWPVSDESTQQLMTNFYSLWMNSGDVYAAFREAQIRLKQTYPEPVYWGAFVMMGK